MSRIVRLNLSIELSTTDAAEVSLADLHAARALLAKCLPGLSGREIVDALMGVDAIDTEGTSCPPSVPPPATRAA